MNLTNLTNKAINKHHDNFSKPREFPNTTKISQHHENFPTPQEFLNTTRNFQHYENFSTDSTLRYVLYTISVKLMFVD